MFEKHFSDRAESILTRLSRDHTITRNEGKAQFVVSRHRVISCLSVCFFAFPKNIKYFYIPPIYTLFRHFFSSLMFSVVILEQSQLLWCFKPGDRFRLSLIKSKTKSESLSWRTILIKNCRFEGKSQKLLFTDEFYQLWVLITFKN